MCQLNPPIVFLIGPLLSLNDITGKSKAVHFKVAQYQMLPISALGRRTFKPTHFAEFRISALTFY